MKRKLICIFIFLVVLNFTVGCSIKNHKSQDSSTSESSDNLSEYEKKLQDVDSIIQKSIFSEKFFNADYSERKKLAEEVLESLEKENKIEKDSIKYAYDNYYFDFLGGGEGCIALNDWKEGVAGNGSSFDGEYNILSENEHPYILHDKNIYNVIQSNNLKYSNSEMKAIIIDAWCREDIMSYLIEDNKKIKIEDFLKRDKEAWSSNNLETDLISYPTVEEFKNILCEKKYDLIDIQCHGYIDKDGNPSIIVAENSITAKILSGFPCEEVINSFNGGGIYGEFKSLYKYSDDLKNKRIGRLYGRFGDIYYLKSQFFTDYYENKINSSIVWIGSCDAYKYDRKTYTYNDTLVKSFSDCGAKAVIAPDNEVRVNYGAAMADAFVNGLLRCQNVEKSLTFAEEQYEKTDEKYGGVGARFRIYIGNNEKLTDLKLIESEASISGTMVDVEGNPIKDLKVYLQVEKNNSLVIETQLTDDEGNFTQNVTFDLNHTSAIIKIYTMNDEYSDYDIENEIRLLPGEKITLEPIVLRKTNPNNDSLTEMYASILDYFYKNISEKWVNYDSQKQLKDLSYEEYKSGVTRSYDVSVGVQGHNIPSITDVSDFLMRYCKDYSLDKIGYQFIDINNDGIMELIVAEIVDAAASPWARVISDLYTINNNEIVHLAASGERDCFSISKNGEVVEKFTNGVASSANNYYSLNNGSLELVKGNSNDNSEYINLDLIPFSSYSKNNPKSENINNKTKINETYSWYIEPSVKAEDIMTSDNCGNGNIYDSYVIANYSVIKNNSKYGVITYDGDFIYKENYDSVYYDIGNIIFSNDSSYERLVLCYDGSTRNDTPWGSGLGNKYFYCNNKIMIGNDIYVPSYENSVAYEELKNKIVPIQKAEISGNQFVNLSKYGLANSEKILVPFEYDNYYYSGLDDGTENNNILPLEKNGKWTYFNKNGEVVVSNCEGIMDSKAYISKYLEQKMYPFNPTDEIIPVKIDGKCGYYDIYGNELVKCGTFEEVRPVHNKKAWVKENGLWGVIEFK